jgi:hypothetical protein
MKISTPPLTAKQARFVAEYLVDGNGARAAVAAGYGRAGARVAAHRLLTRANVQKALQARQTADATRLSTQREDVIQGLLGAIQDAKAKRDPGAMISGWATIARLMGFNRPEVHRVDVCVDQGDEMRRLEGLSDAELEKLIAGEALALEP